MTCWIMAWHHLKYDSFFFMKHVCISDICIFFSFSFLMRSWKFLSTPSFILQYKKLCVFRSTWNSSGNQSLYAHTTNWMNWKSLSLPNPKLLCFGIINSFHAHSIYPSKNCVLLHRLIWECVVTVRKSWSFFTLVPVKLTFR